MAKTKTGYVPLKGKPTGSGCETHGLKNALWLMIWKQGNN